MRNFLCVACFLIGFSLSSQELDSIQIESQVTSLLDSSKFYLGNGDRNMAFAKQKEAHQLSLGKFGPKSTSLIYCLQHLGNIYFATHDYENAEQSYREALDLCTTLRSKEHPQCLSILGNLAYVHTTAGNLEKAEKLHVEKKTIHEHKGDTLSKLYSNTLNNLAITYFFWGKYEKAERLYLKTLALRANILGKNNPDYCGTLINLGSLYSDMGMNEMAEPLWLEAKLIFEDSLKNLDHPFYINCLSNLSAFYFLIGSYEKAESGWEQQMNRFEEAEDTLNPNYAITLANVAEIYKINRQADRAEATWKKALRITENLYGSNSEQYARLLTKLASLHMENDNLKWAEDLLVQADQILRNNNESSPTAMMANLTFMADLYQLKGEREKVGLVLNEYRDLCVKYLGRNNDYYSHIMLSLGIHHAEMKQGDKAALCFEESSEIDRQILLKSLHHLSERELQKYLINFDVIQSKLLSYAIQTSNPLIDQVIFDNSLFYKGFLLHALNQTRRLALDHPETSEMYENLKSMERLLIQNYSVPLQERNDADIAALEMQINELEKNLARQIDGFERALRQVRWKEVQKALNPGEAVIEFVRFENMDRNSSGHHFYAALVLKPGLVHPKTIRLFEEAALDSLMKSNEGRKANYVNQLYSLVDRGASTLESARRSLYEIIWKPLESELSDVQSIFFSPSGLLHRINFAGIAVSGTETLADRFKLFQMTSARQKVMMDQRNFTHNNAILFGGINYDPDSTEVEAGSMLAIRSKGEVEFNAAQGSTWGGSWNYLSGTEREVNAIEKMMRASGVNPTLQKGFMAREELFKKCGTGGQLSPRVIHLATHGYFFSDAGKEVDSEQSRHEKASGTGRTHIMTGTVGIREPVFKISEHPMLRSGLILAGGNAGWQGKRSLVGGEDGVLTAYEISQMNLSNTELVVLSACETGLGDIQGNEGVYGLQRAFKIAGVKYIIMSLWQVPDKQTGLLMTTFYKKWLEAEGPDKGGKKMTIPDAFHAAQKELRELGFDPYQWAGFVLIE